MIEADLNLSSRIQDLLDIIQRFITFGNRVEISEDEIPGRLHDQLDMTTIRQLLDRLNGKKLGQGEILTVAADSDGRRVIKIQAAARAQNHN